MTTNNEDTAMTNNESNEDWPWDLVINNIPIIQDMIYQRPDSCVFTAVTRQIEYQLRRTYAKADPPTRLRRGALFNHEAWQDELCREFPEVGNRRWSIHFLMQRAKSHGVPLWNNLKHKVVDFSFHVAPTVVDVLRHLETGPIVGVFDVRSDFCYDGSRQYFGTGDDVPEDDGMGSTRCSTHAVVLLEKARLEGCEDWFIVYQNSGGDPDKSSLKRGLNCVRANMIREVYMCWSYPPNVMVPQQFAAEAAQHGYSS